MVKRAVAVLGLPLVGACPWGEKSFENGTTAEKCFESWYDMPCPAMEAALHARYGARYMPVTVPFGFPFSLACADRMYTPVGGKAPSVFFGASS